MSNRVGWGVLQIIPSAKDFGRHLRDETKAPIAEVGREHGKSLGEQITRGAKAPLSAGGDNAGKSFGKRLVSAAGAVVSAGMRGIASVLSSILPEFLKSATAGATSAITSAVTSAGTAVSSGGAMTAATGGLNLLIGALLAAAAAAVVLGTGLVTLAPIVLIAGGAFGSMFTIVAGGAATLAVFKLGLHGISDAFAEVTEKGKASSKTLKELSPNARRLVREFEKWQKPLNSVRRFVQDKLLDKMDVSARNLARRWLPSLKPMLGGLATSFNKFGKSVLTALGNTTFVKNIRAAVGGFGGFIERLGRSAAPFFDAFGRLARASVPFLAEIGDRLGGVITKFSAWIRVADESGALKTFMQDAVQALRDIWSIGGLVIGIVGEVIDIFFPSSKRASGSFLGDVKNMLTALQTWLGDEKNKQKIRDIMTDIGDFVKMVTKEWIPKAIEWGTKIDGWVTKIDGWATKIGRFKDAILGLPGSIVSTLSGAGNLLYTAGKNVVLGFARGIRESAGAVVAAIKSAITDALPSYVKRALGINSPSRVFMALGLSVPEGMALGILRGAGRVTKAVGALTAIPAVTGESGTGTTRRGDASGTTGGPLIGSLVLNASDSVRDQLDEVTFLLRRIRQGGVYA